VALATTSISMARLRAGAVWWLELRPHEGGRSVLARCEPGGEPVAIAPEPLAPRSIRYGELEIHRLPA
jgi:hypothetical protein